MALHDAAISPAWYLPERKKDRHDALFGTATFLCEKQKYRTDANLANLRLYCNREARNLTGEGYARDYSEGDRRNRLTVNVARSIIDTIHSKIIQSSPKPTFLTSGGDSSSQNKAKLLDKLCGGMFYHSGWDQARSRRLKDAEIFGTGVTKIIADRDGKPKCERVFVDELIVDEQEALNGQPRNFFQKRVCDREMVIAMWPEYEKKILDAELPGRLAYNPNSIADQVLVVEGWHLPSFPGADDGRHSICLNTVTLVDEPWERDYPPFVVSRWMDQPLGWYGQGICEQVRGIQIEINLLLRTIQEQMRLAGPKILIERGSSINQRIDNEIWGVINYTGQPPTFATFQSVHPEMFQQVERLYQKAFDEIGVSQLSAQSQKPAGLNSGKALLTYHEIESERFVAFGQEDERACLEGAHQMLDIARESHLRSREDDDAKPFVVKHAIKRRGQKFLQEVKWSDIDVQRDEYVVQIFPTSQLPNSPAGRLQYISELMDRDILTREEAIRLLDFPDIEGFTSLATAALDDVEMLLEKMLEDGVSQEPDAFTPHDLSIQHMTSALLRAEVHGVEERKRDLVRNFIAKCVKLKELQAPPAPPPQMPTEMGPAAQGQPPPGAAGQLPPEAAALMPPM